MVKAIKESKLPFVSRRIFRATAAISGAADALLADAGFFGDVLDGGEVSAVLMVLLPMVLFSC